VADQQPQETEPGLTERLAKDAGSRVISRASGAARASFAASKIGTKLTSMIGGLASGGVLSAVQAAAETIRVLRNNWDKILATVFSVSFLSNLGAILAFFLSALLVPAIIAAVSLIIVVALILFVINSGAYIVPPSTTSTFAINPGLVVAGNCPLQGTTIITTTSYNPQTETGHGSLPYWSGMEACSFNIPIYAMTGSECRGPTTGSSTNPCTDLSQLQERYGEDVQLCEEYGYAVDVVATDYAADQDVPVYLPTLCDSAPCGPLTWTVASYFYVNPGWGIVLDAEGNGHSYRLYLLHINQPTVTNGQTMASGQQIGTLFNYQYRHLHIELNIDGESQQPDFLCGGGYIPGFEGDGWYIEVPLSQATDWLASTPGEYGRSVCSFSESHNLSWAVNANFFGTPLEPDGPSGYGGEYTNIYPSHDQSTFYMFVVRNNGSAEILGAFDYHERFNTYCGGDCPPPPTDLSDFRLVITGVAHTSYSASQINRVTGRTVIGIGNGNLYVVTLVAATPAQGRAVMESLGAIQSFQLDGGSSTSLCSNGESIFRGTNIVANSFGGRFGRINVLGQQQ